MGRDRRFTSPLKLSRSMDKIQEVAHDDYYSALLIQNHTTWPLVLIPTGNVFQAELAAHAYCFSTHTSSPHSLLSSQLACGQKGVGKSNEKISRHTPKDSGVPRSLANTTTRSPPWTSTSSLFLAFHLILVLSCTPCRANGVPTVCVLSIPKPQPYHSLVLARFSPQQSFVRLGSFSRRIPRTSAYT
jgi:hypothetical protein